MLTPVGPTSRNADMLTPVGPTSRNADMLTPVGPTSRNADLPTPVGPTSRKADLPAPKGFFDDIPAPSDAGAPGATGNLPAPKGFFDDVPAPVAPGSSRGSGNLPAPKGFFDDIPAPKQQHDLELDAPQLDAAQFDSIDLAEPLAPVGGGSTPRHAPAAAAGPADAARGFFDDIGGGDSGALDLDDLDLAPPQSSSAPPLDLSDPGDAPPLDLGASGFGNVDLPGQEETLSLAQPSAPANDFAPRPEQDQLLDLDEEVVAEQTARVAGEARQLEKAKAKAEQEAKPRSKKPLIALAAVVLVGGLGAGGWLLWSRHQAAKARDAEVAQHLTAARRFLISDKPRHWDAALDEANKALAVESKQADALGIAAQAAYAGYLDEGTELQKRRDAGRSYIARINDAAASGPECNKAEALRAIFEGTPKGALAPLGQALSKQPSDPNIPLYQGWAYQALHDHKNALAVVQARAGQVAQPHPRAVRAGTRRAGARQQRRGAQGLRLPAQARRVVHRPARTRRSLRRSGRLVSAGRRQALCRPREPVPRDHQPSAEGPGRPARGVAGVVAGRQPGAARRPR